jgi:hypothetical protein
MSDSLTTLGHALADARAADARLREAVDAARTDGRTWSEIGDVLGTSRQAAFQRFGKPIDPRTGAPMSTDTLPGAVEKAVALFVDLAEGNWETVRRDFDERVTQALPDAAAVAAVWAAVAARYGRWEQGMGEPVTYRLADYTVVDIPLRFEVGEQIGRATFSQDGKVAGIFVLAPEER